MSSSLNLNCYEDQTPSIGPKSSGQGASSNTPFQTFGCISTQDSRRDQKRSQEASAAPELSGRNEFWKWSSLQRKRELVGADASWLAV